MRTRSIFLLAVLLALAMLATACKPEQSTLQTSQKRWATLYEQASLLLAQKVITEGQWRRFADLDTRYRSAYNAADEAMRVYQSVKNDANHNALDAALANLAGIIISGQNLINTFKK